LPPAALQPLELVLDIETLCDVDILILQITEREVLVQQLWSIHSLNEPLLGRLFDAFNEELLRGVESLLDVEEQVEEASILLNHV
jgi:hypothetical protein